MWEIYSCGELPYAGMSNMEVIDYIAKGERLKRVSVAMLTSPYTIQAQVSNC
jgi:hypothetical protein